MVKKVITHECDRPNGPVIREISANTQIVFTVKGFLLAIAGLLGIFYGFYQLVVVPKVDATEKQYVKMYDDQKQQNAIFYQELGKINTSIGALNSSVNALTSKRSLVQSSGTRGSDVSALPMMTIPNNNTTVVNPYLVLHSE